MESIILLILRLLYIEKRNELGLHDDVVILSEDIHEKYSMLKIEAKSNIDKTTFKETIRIFKRYNIISTIDTDITKPDARIKIYPSVLFAVSNDNINDAYQKISVKLNKYLNGGVNTDEDEEINEN